MFMYYETDGDSGFYNIELFSSRLEAEKYHKKTASNYGNVCEIEVDKEVEPMASKTTPLEETLCPECGSKMLSRKGTYGVFWGCSTYPKCRGTRDNEGRSKAERAAQRDNEPLEAVDDKYRFRRS